MKTTKTMLGRCRACGADGLFDSFGQAPVTRSGSVDLWKEACCKMEGMASVSELYRSYERWCEQNGVHCSSLKMFSMNLMGGGVSRGRVSSGSVAVGLSLNEPLPPVVW